MGGKRKESFGSSSQPKARRKCQQLETANRPSISNAGQKNASPVDTKKVQAATRSRNSRVKGRSNLNEMIQLIADGLRELPHQVEQHREDSKIAEETLLESSTNYARLYKRIILLIYSIFNAAIPPTRSGDPQSPPQMDFETNFGVSSNLNSAPPMEETIFDDDLIDTSSSSSRVCDHLEDLNTVTNEAQSAKALRLLQRYLSEQNKFIQMLKNSANTCRKIEKERSATNKQLEIHLGYLEKKSHAICQPATPSPRPPETLDPPLDMKSPALAQVSRHFVISNSQIQEVPSNESSSPSEIPSATKQLMHTLCVIADKLEQIVHNQAQPNTQNDEILKNQQRFEQGQQFHSNALANLDSKFESKCASMEALVTNLIGQLFGADDFKDTEYYSSPFNSLVNKETVTTEDPHPHIQDETSVECVDESGDDHYTRMGASSSSGP